MIERDGALKLAQTFRYERDEARESYAAALESIREHQQIVLLLLALLREARKYVAATAEMDYYEPNAANAAPARDVLTRIDAALEAHDATRANRG
jgi:hypothetical protein